MINPTDYGISFDEYLKEQMKDSQFRKNFNKFQNQDAISIAILVGRKKAGLSQKELSTKANVPLETIKSLENGDNLHINTAVNVINALNGKISIDFD